MKKVLQIIASMNAGGMENMLMNYYRNMNREKIQYDFLIFTEGQAFYEEEILSLGGKIYKITARRKNFFKNRKELKEFFIKHANEYDIMEFHQGITYFYPLKLAKKFNVKHRIIHNHGIDRNYLKKLKLYNNLYAKRRISNLATDYFTCSEEVNEQLFSKKVMKAKEIKIIHNAIDVKKYKYDIEKRKRIREELNIEEDTYVFGHIGTFTYPKNHRFLIEQYNKICKERENCLLLLIGEGPLKEEIKEQIKGLEIEDRIKFLGLRKDIPNILSAMDTLIFPSIFEGIPLTLIEAQASGLRQILSNNINEKVKLTNLCNFLPLEKEEEWIKMLLDFKKVDYRENYNKEIENTKYNICNVAKELQETYEKMK